MGHEHGAAYGVLRVRINVDGHADSYNPPRGLFPAKGGDTLPRSPEQRNSSRLVRIGSAPTTGSLVVRLGGYVGGPRSARTCQSNSVTSFSII